MTAIKTTSDLFDSLRNQRGNFTSLGSYTVMYVHADGECSHPECVRAAALSEGRKVRDYDHDRIVSVDTYDEGPTLQCVLCSEGIDSSYGEPEEH